MKREEKRREVRNGIPKVEVAEMEISCESEAIETLTLTLMISAPPLPLSLF